MLFLISLLLALVPLLGVVWIAVQGLFVTVDGLFMSLILLAISGIFGGGILLDVRKHGLGVALARGVRGALGGQSTVSASAAGVMQRGKVEKVEFFESHVGQPNKSIVTLSNGSTSYRMMVFEGDLRNALPTGRKVEITFRRATGHNVLVNVSYP